VTTNADKIGATNNSSQDSPEIKIYASKSQANSVPNGLYGTPAYREFENSGTRKYAPSSFGGNIGSPTNPTGSVPNLSESAWENAAPDAPAAINAGGNVWSSESELE
jgi:hypothetical protein